MSNGTGGILSWFTQIPSFRDNTFSANQSNCGVRNDTGFAVNYWGASTGPGSDPADQLCETHAGDEPDSTVTPFLTKDPTQAQSALR